LKHSTESWKAEAARIQALKQGRVILTTYDAVIKSCNQPSKPKKHAVAAVHAQNIKTWEDKLKEFDALHEL